MRRYKRVLDSNRKNVIKFLKAFDLKTLDLFFRALFSMSFLVSDWASWTFLYMKIVWVVMDKLKFFYALFGCLINKSVRVYAM